jgi:dephospho-CoA kinase
MANRPVRPLTSEQVDQRDWAEIENIEKGGPIAIADHYIINDGTVEKLHEQLDNELNHIEFYDQ